MDNRNIVDLYKYWSVDAIKADLDTRRHSFGVLCSNLSIDYNIASVIRNSNAFLANRVYIYGRKNWDRRGAVGTHNYQHINYIKELSELPLDKYILIGVDNIENAIDIRKFSWPKNALMAFGQETVGLPQEIISICKDIVYIPQMGSVRSLNVGCASAIAMYSWINQYHDS